MRAAGCRFDFERDARVGLRDFAAGLGGAVASRDSSAAWRREERRLHARRAARGRSTSAAAGVADAMCFAPLNKAALRAGGMHHADELH